MLFLCQITIAQKSEMTVNQNQYNSDFKASNKLIEKFRVSEKTTDEFKLIAELNIEKISVFIQNNSTNSVSISHQDNSIYILQEAKDENGIWKPIEYWESSDCGNSFGGIEIKPNEVIETKSNKYQGNFKTEIRIKLSANDKVFYSNSLNGTINPNKLIMPDDFSFLWPLAIIGKETPIELQKKVVFLEPNGTEEFNEFFTKSRNEKKKN